MSEEREQSAEGWRTGLARATPPAQTVVAVADGEIVGFAGIGVARDEPPGVGELYTIYVEPDAWGRGCGRALMAEMLSRLRAEGFSEAVLWVLEDNPRTRRFYELCGWAADGGMKEEEWLGTLVREVRYRIALVPAR
jgi:GNAT superfamily N-acetyltransferase